MNKHYEYIAKNKGVPEHTAGALSRWILDGIEPGGFLKAVLTNDLKESFGRADGENIKHMKEIIMFLYNDAPMSCWGSVERYGNWEGLNT